MRCSAFGLLASLALSLTACAPRAGEDPSLLFDRVWIDSIPSKPTDYAHVAYLLPEPAIGIFQRASNYEIRAEQFEHRREGQTLTLTFPQTGKKAEVKFEVTACQDLPPFDLCLDLTDNPWGGPKRYHGKRQQDDGDEAARKRMRARLEGR